MIFKRFISIIIYLILFITLLCLLISFIGINKVGNSDREAIISAIVTIFVFGAGIFAQMIGNKIYQLKKDKQLKRIFQENQKIILEGLRLQIGNFAQIIEILKSEYPENIMLSSYAELEYFEINKISSEDLYRIFIDYKKGDEKANIITLEKLRKELRFIEYSRDLIISNFEKLYINIRENTENVIKGFVDLGGFFDKEATRLLSNKDENIEEDAWFLGFSDIMGEVKASLKISDDTYTDYEKLESQIIPMLYDFARDNMEDTRTPIITSILSKFTFSIFQRKDTIKNLIKLVEFYLEKYKEAQKVISRTLDEYSEY